MDGMDGWAFDRLEINNHKLSKEKNEMSCQISPSCMYTGVDNE